MTAGRLLALAYLFCVLAPGVALALGDAASCLMPEMAIAEHVHDGAQPEHAASHQHQANAEHSNAEHSGSEQPRHQHNGKGAMSSCCAMLCMSAIADDLPSVATPSQPISLWMSENFQRLPSKAPPLLYRPPIA